MNELEASHGGQSSEKALEQPPARPPPTVPTNFTLPTHNNDHKSSQTNNNNNMNNNNHPPKFSSSETSKNTQQISSNGLQAIQNGEHTTLPFQSDLSGKGHHWGTKSEMVELPLRDDHPSPKPRVRIGQSSEKALENPPSRPPPPILAEYRKALVNNFHEKQPTKNQIDPKFNSDNTMNTVNNNNNNRWSYTSNSHSQSLCLEEDEDHYSEAKLPETSVLDVPISQSQVTQEFIPQDYVQKFLSWTIDEAAWKLEKKNQSPDGTIFSRMWTETPNSKLLAIKVVTQFDCPIENILYVLHTHLVEHHKDWNATFIEGRVVQTFNQDSNIQYWRYHRTGITDRDFLVAHRKIDNPDGSVILFDRTVEDHRDCPLRKDAIRCYLPVNLRILERGENTSQTKYTYMNYTDVKGLIPHWLVNKANPTTSWEEIVAIKKLCESIQI